MKVEQPILGRRGTLALLAALAAFPPLTMDLYLPALPQMTDVFATSHGMVALTIGAFIVAFAFGMLFWGPLSERTGRKPILLISLVIYIAGSICCALARSIEALIVFRVLQGFAGGGAAVVGTTIVKDMYDGRERERVMAVVMSLAIIAPLVAPILGAMLLQFGSWRLMFVVLAAFGCSSLILVACYRETLEQKSDGSVLRLWGRLGTVIRNPRFAYLLLIFAISQMCLMSFIGISAYVYVNTFGLSEQAFSVIFALNAGAAMLAPNLYLQLSRGLRVQDIILGCFGSMVIGGMAVLWIGDLSPWTFAAIAAFCTIAIVMAQVPGTNLLLDQQVRDTGSAAALIKFSVTLMGAVGIQIASLDPDDLIRNFGAILLVVGTLCTVLWLLVRRRPFVADSFDQPGRGSSAPSPGAQPR